MKKHFVLTIALAFAMICGAQTSCWDGTIAETYAGGDGTAANPYQIATAEQLALLAQQTNIGLEYIRHYSLTNDICLSGSDSIPWIPIGTNKVFTGTFNGNGHTVSDMYVADSEVGGLFGYTCNATITNLNIENSTINNVKYAGLIVGNAEKTHIIDCAVDGLVSYEGDDYYSNGGVVGWMFINNSGTDTIYIKNCVNHANVIGNTSVNHDGEAGGIVGELHESWYSRHDIVIEDCVNYGNIVTNGDAGGIVGLYHVSTNKIYIRNCENYGEIAYVNSGNSGYTGGIVGDADGSIGTDSYIENCINHSSGEVSGICIGGIAGLSYGSITKCVNHAPITGKLCLYGQRYAGGIAGLGSNISNCYNTGDVTYAQDTTNTRVGGIAGYVSATSTFRNVYNTGAVTATSNAYRGIIIGSKATNSNCMNSYWHGDYDIPACGDGTIPEGSCAFRQGATPTTWVLDEPQYGTTDLVEALNAGANGECEWLEDEDFINNGLPIFVDIEPTYPFIGTEWYYEITNANGGITYQYLECIADTTIGTTRPKIIVKSNTLYDKDLITQVTHEYVYSDGGMVYWWDKQSQSYTTLYNFDANIDDEWTINVGNQSITVHVNGINNIEHDGKNYRVLTINDADDIFSGDIICGIGHTASFFPEKLLNNRDFDVDGMRCYWLDGEQLLHFGEVDCDEIYNIYNDVAENEETGVEVYPNPAKDILIIKSDVLEMCHGASLQEYTITNITGQIMMRGTISSDNQQINIENLPDGMYFVNINNQIVKIIKN